MSTKFEYDKDFVPAKPSVVFSRSHGPVAVMTSLYGEVSAQRLAKEQAECAYRAEQLAPIVRRPRRDEIPDLPHRETERAFIAFETGGARGRR